MDKTAVKYNELRKDKIVYYELRWIVQLMNDYIPALVGCVERLLSLAQNCQSCIKSLVCCVTDSCR